MPARYSVASVANILQNGVHHSSKGSNGEKKWDLSVTYVEVRLQAAHSEVLYLYNLDLQ